MPDLLHHASITSLPIRVSDVPCDRRTKSEGELVCAGHSDRSHASQCAGPPGLPELSHVAYKPYVLQHFDTARATPRTVAPPQRHNCIRGNKQNAGDCGVAAPAPEDMRNAGPKP